MQPFTILGLRWSDYDRTEHAVFHRQGTDPADAVRRWLDDVGAGDWGWSAVAVFPGTLESLIPVQ